MVYGQEVGTSCEHLSPLPREEGTVTCIETECQSSLILNAAPPLHGPSPGTLSLSTVLGEELRQGKA